MPPLRRRSSMGRWMGALSAQRDACVTAAAAAPRLLFHVIKINTRGTRQARTLILSQGAIENAKKAGGWGALLRPASASPAIPLYNGSGSSSSPAATLHASPSPATATAGSRQGGVEADGDAPAGGAPAHSRLATPATAGVASSGATARGLVGCALDASWSGLEAYMDRGDSASLVATKQFPYTDVTYATLDKSGRLLLRVRNDHDFIYESPVAPLILREVQRRIARALEIQTLSNTLKAPAVSQASARARVQAIAEAGGNVWAEERLGRIVQCLLYDDATPEGRVRSKFLNSDVKRLVEESDAAMGKWAAAQAPPPSASTPTPALSAAAIAGAVRASTPDKLERSRWLSWRSKPGGDASPVPSAVGGGSPALTSVVGSADVSVSAAGGVAVLSSGANAIRVNTVGRGVGSGSAGSGSGNTSSRSVAALAGLTNSPKAVALSMHPIPRPTGAALLERAHDLPPSLLTVAQAGERDADAAASAAALPALAKCSLCSASLESSPPSDSGATAAVTAPATAASHVPDTPQGTPQGTGSGAGCTATPAGSSDYASASSSGGTDDGACGGAHASVPHSLGSRPTAPAPPPPPPPPKRTPLVAPCPAPASPSMAEVLSLGEPASSSVRAPPPPPLSLRASQGSASTSCSSCAGHSVSSLEPLSEPAASTSSNGRSMLQASAARPPYAASPPRALTVGHAQAGGSARHVDGTLAAGAPAAALLAAPLPRALNAVMPDVHSAPPPSLPLTSALHEMVNSLTSHIMSKRVEMLDAARDGIAWAPGQDAPGASRLSGRPTSGSVAGAPLSSSPSSSTLGVAATALPAGQPLGRADSNVSMRDVLTQHLRGNSSRSFSTASLGTTDAAGGSAVSSARDSRRTASDFGFRSQRADTTLDLLTNLMVGNLSDPITVKQIVAREVEAAFHNAPAIKSAVQGFAAQVAPASHALALASRIAIMRHAPQSFFGIAPRLEQADGWQAAVEQLRRVDAAGSPTEKLACLQASARAVYAAYARAEAGSRFATLLEEADTLMVSDEEDAEQGETLPPAVDADADAAPPTNVAAATARERAPSSRGADAAMTQSNSIVSAAMDIPSLGADDFFPIHVFVVVHAALVNPLATKDLLWMSGNAEELRGQMGYYLTVFEAALEFIRTVPL